MFVFLPSAMSSQVRYLLVNNNNSRTKFALASADALLEHRVLPTPELSEDSFASLLEGWTYESAVLASVVPRSGELIRHLLNVPLVNVTWQVALGVELDFPDPSTIGADRLANAAAVAALYDVAPAIVVDFGTAVTFDIISRDKAYVGGVIAPGLDAMRDYLHQRTALLPKIDLREPPTAIGKSTEDAMLAGAVHGYRGLVREILMQVAAELAQKEGPDAAAPKIIATGGYAELIAAGLPEISEIQPVLTMEGLRIIGNLNTAT